MNDSNLNNSIKHNSPPRDGRGASRPVLSAVSTRDRIAGDLRTRISVGEIRPGELLPSRRALAQEYDVAIGTMQSAIVDLIAEGILVARDRMGTFVAETVACTAVPEHTIVRPSNFGLVIEQSSGWPDTIARVLEQELSQQGGRTQVANVDRVQDGASLARAVCALQADGVEGIAIILPSSDDPFAEIASVFDDRTPHCVFVVSQPVLSPRVSCVYYDSRDAGYQAAQYLLQQGCMDLLFFAPCTAHWVAERCDGVKQALRHASMNETALQSWIAPVSFSEFHRQGTDYVGSAYLEARRYLNDHVPPSGVIAANDAIALGFWQAAEELNLKPGRDFALIGFDDNLNSRERGLSSLHPPLEALAASAATLLLQEHRKTETTRVCLRSRLIARASTHLHRKDRERAPQF